MRRLARDWNFLVVLIGGTATLACVFARSTRFLRFSPALDAFEASAMCVTALSQIFHYLVLWTRYKKVIKAGLLSLRDRRQEKRKFAWFQKASFPLAWDMIGCLFLRGFRRRVYSPSAEELKIDYRQLCAQHRSGWWRMWVRICAIGWTIAVLFQCYKELGLNLFWKSAKTVLPAWLWWKISTWLRIG
jgi:hypothetical protein